MVTDRFRGEKNTALSIFAPGQKDMKVHSFTQLNQDGWAYMLIDADFEFGDENHNYEVVRVPAKNSSKEPRTLASFSFGTN